jgi:hypothetical protein
MLSELKLKANKYKNVFTKVKGELFHSKKEAKRYEQLLLLEKAGEISGLKTQVKFVIIPKNDQFRETSYIADFTYYEGDIVVVEDVKGFITDVFKIKRKLMYSVHKILLRES